jgi:hypothetical protein
MVHRRCYGAARTVHGGAGLHDALLGQLGRPACELSHPRPKIKSFLENSILQKKPKKNELGHPPKKKKKRS